MCRSAFEFGFSNAHIGEQPWLAMGRGKAPGLRKGSNWVCGVAALSWVCGVGAAVGASGPGVTPRPKVDPLRTRQSPTFIFPCLFLPETAARVAFLHFSQKSCKILQRASLSAGFLSMFPFLEKMILFVGQISCGPRWALVRCMRRNVPMLSSSAAAPLLPCNRAPTPPWYL